MREDLPTLLRPIKAYSGRSGGGHLSTEGLLMRYEAWMISMVQRKGKVSLLFFNLFLLYVVLPSSIGFRYMQVEYTIKRYNPNQFASLKQLFKSVFHIEIALASFNKKYNTKTLGTDAINYVAIDNSTRDVVSHFAALPVLALIHGEEVKAAQSSDALTHENHQKKGLFKLLAEHVHKESQEKGISLLFSQPNNASLHAFINSFQFEYVDNIIRWDMKLRLKTAPLAKIFIYAGFQRAYLRYCAVVLKKYRIAPPKDLTNTLNTTDARIIRNEAYISYKAAEDKFFIRIEDAVFWIKLTDILWIGEIKNYETVNLSVLRKIRRLAFRLGYNTISFHLNEKVSKPKFLNAFKYYKSEPSTIYYFDKKYRGTNLILTGADFDTW